MGRRKHRQTIKYQLQVHRTEVNRAKRKARHEKLLKSHKE
jgi:hypothetical protein